MAPTWCMAIYLPAFFVLFALILSDYGNVSAQRLKYNRQFLLDIKASQELREKLTFGSQSSGSCSPPPFLASVPDFLRRIPASCVKRRRQRRRGKRAGLMVRARACLYWARRRGEPLFWREIHPSVRHEVFPLARCLLPVAAVDPCADSMELVHVRIPTPDRRWRKGRGVNFANLRGLTRAPVLKQVMTPLRMGLFNPRSLTGKAFALKDFISSRRLDLFFLVETWVKHGESAVFSELLPPDYSFINTPREKRRGGGVASVFTSRLQCRQVRYGTALSSFELQMMELKLEACDPVLCALLYRAPGYNKDFIQEFSGLLTWITLSYDAFFVCGDMNIHVCCPTKPLSQEFLSTVESFDLTQSVNGATHENGHTLDLILSHGVNICVNEIVDTGISDHRPVLFDFVPPCSLQTVPASRIRRDIGPTTAAQFSSMFSNSVLCWENIDELVSAFSSSCCEILDNIAPFRVLRARKVCDPWLNETTRDLRRQCRRAERKWQRDRLLVSLQIFRSALAAYHNAVKQAKSTYMCNIVMANREKPRVLFNVFNAIVNPRADDGIHHSEGLCESFLSFFVEKINQLRSSFSLARADSVMADASPFIEPFVQFERVTLSDLDKVVRALRPSFCPTDCLPSKFLKEVFNSVGPVVLNVVNDSLSSGCVPAVFKHAVVQPLLKKHNLDQSDLSNFRPISKLPFLSKVLEKVVFQQLQSHLDCNEIGEKFQSGFKQSHSTETALLRVFNDIYSCLDSGCSAALLLLDLSSAFDTVNHEILLARLKSCASLEGKVLDWFRSYLTDRTFSIRLGAHQSRTVNLDCGVPQGSILGPILFIIYLLPLGSIFRKYDVSFHCFADDIQIYVPFRSNGPAFESFKNCLRDVKDWLFANQLRLNDKKTELVVFGDPTPLQGVDTALGPLSTFSLPCVKTLGVLVDSALKLDKQISAVVKSGFFHLRLLSKVKPYLPIKEFERVIHAFVSSRLDYCNTVYFGLDQGSIRRLQLVQNAAARLLTGTRRYDHITPVLKSLHWLPVTQRIQFKMLLLVYKSLNGSAPAYLRELLSVRTNAYNSRSSSQLVLAVPRSKLRSRGDRAFSVAGPVLWNGLPPSVRSAPTLEHFKSLLKTHLFSLAF